MRFLALDRIAWIFALLLASATTRGDMVMTVWNVRELGAAGDGTTLDTAAIQSAIDTCTQNGGGTVLLPAGKYLCGTITLKSHVALEIGSGAILLASQRREDYPLVDDAWEDGHKTIAPLIWADGAENITITGRGTIDGQGESWWRPILERAARRGRQATSGPASLAASRPATGPTTRLEGEAALGRPQLIRVVRCKDVVIEKVSLVNSPAWNIHPLFCERVRVDGVTITARVPSPNTDGINPESCRNVQISNCRIDVGDDCVTLKSGINEIGRKMGRPDEDITISNCVMYKGHGGVTIGSEMSGGVRNVTVMNCVFHGTDNGIRIKSQRGRGGVVEGLTVSNVVMHDVPHPFTITTFYMTTDKPGETFAVGEGTPRFRDLVFSNITVRGARDAGSITGLREMPVENITFSNVHVQSDKGFTCASAQHVRFQDVVIDNIDGPPLTQRDCAEIDTARLRTAAGPVVRE